MRSCDGVVHMHERAPDCSLLGCLWLGDKAGRWKDGMGLGG